MFMEGSRDAMLVKMQRIKIEMSKLSEKIARRIEELENDESETVVLYRNDLVIDQAMRELLHLHHKGREICAHDNTSESICNRFKDVRRKEEMRVDCS